MLIEMTDGGLDYTFEAVGNVELMRSALVYTRVGASYSDWRWRWAGNFNLSLPACHGQNLAWNCYGWGLPGMVDEWLRGDFSVDP